MNKFKQYILDSKYYIYIYEKVKNIYNNVYIWYVFKLHSLTNFILPKYFKFS